MPLIECADRAAGALHSARPPGRAAHLTAATLTAAIVAVRIWIAHRITFCGTPDSCAYLALGESLSRHKGFVENFLYQYQMVDVHLPQHGVEYWRPGTSLFFLLAQPFGGVSLESSLVITIFAGVALALAAWRMAQNLWGDQRLACLAYALCLVLGPMWQSSLTPDSSLFYGAAAAWFLVLFRVRFTGYTQDALAWVCLVLVNLIRNDAILLLIPVLAVLWLRRRAGMTRGASWIYCGVVVAGFALAGLPMRAIRYAVMGKAVASHTLDSLYLTSLSELLYYHQPASLHTALALGLKHLLLMRLAATATIVYRILFLMGGFGIVLFSGLWLRRSHRATQAWLHFAGPAVFAAVTVVVYGLALPAIGTFSALRTATALLPAASVAMVCGAVGLAASFRAARTLGWAFAGFYAISGFMSSARAVGDMNATGDEDRAVARYLSANGAAPESGTLIMTADAAQFAVTTSYAAVPIPSNGSAATLAAVRDLHPAFVLVRSSGHGDYESGLVQALHPAQIDHVPGTDVDVLEIAAPAKEIRP